MSKEFDLDAALNKDAKIRTRCGYPARIICIALNSDKPVVAVVVTENGEEVISCTKKGRCYADNIIESNYDLVMVPEKRYINLFIDKDGKYFCGKKSYPTVEMAKELDVYIPLKCKGSRYVATVEVEE